MTTNCRRIDIHVPLLTRVEGEGALELSVSDGRIETLHLRIFEPPRLFEKLVEGYGYDEVLDMVARICGICPVAYQITAAQAFEDLFEVDPGPWVRAVRRLIYCGEWLQSHALHIHLLALPDYFGFTNAIDMARSYSTEIRRGLSLQALGNDIISLFGARSVHPVGLRVGGVYHAPGETEVAALQTRLESALDDTRALIAWCAGLDFPDHGQPFTSVALVHPTEYPMDRGRILSGDGLDIDIGSFEAHFSEHQVPHSTALYSTAEGNPYLVGPLARLNLNLHQLPGPVREVLDGCGVGFPSHNMFHSILARAVEMHFAAFEALRLVREYRRPDRPGVEVQPLPGTAVGCTEAPRGLLWHRYEMDQDGRVRRARIVPPTSQNQARIEQDLRHSLESYGLDRSDDELRSRAEMIIRNYDPCISCATHFLKLDVKRRVKP